MVISRDKTVVFIKTFFTVRTNVSSFSVNKSNCLFSVRYIGDFLYSIIVYFICKATTTRAFVLFYIQINVYFNIFSFSLISFIFTSCNPTNFLIIPSVDIFLLTFLYWIKQLYCIGFLRICLFFCKKNKCWCGKLQHLFSRLKGLIKGVKADLRLTPAIQLCFYTILCTIYKIVSIFLLRNYIHKTQNPIILNFDF